MALPVTVVLIDQGTQTPIAGRTVGGNFYQGGTLFYESVGDVLKGINDTTQKLPVIEAALALLIGEVAVNPTANTIQDRLKAILTGTVLAGGSNAIGKLLQPLDAADFGGATPNALDSVTAAGSESGAIACLNKHLVIVHTEYANNTVVAPLTLNFLGNNAAPATCPSVEITPANKSRQGGVLEAGYYQGETFIIHNVGPFASFKVYLEATIAAAVSVWAVAV